MLNFPISSNDDVNSIDDDKVVIDEILIPLEYDDVDFRFNNLGTFANTVVNGIGVFFLKSQEDVLIGAIKKLIQQNVHSLICWKREFFLEKLTEF